ncbi:MAG: methionine--tRNA ligase [Candidatus Muiribacterium halophilum]|uniref:Methionine--tRNA ligase n=1 Tax=Muiribacterium halophilum TaxID=2053465 RepID=A0A2N5ZDJ4_MUIH1|nr:MAG: methionine--tRNA ligase [Candidatus Muirbacterium halophilum]
MEKRPFYITTAIDYVNSVPHIGHALEKIGADVIARYKRLDGFDVRFTIGTDEHGSKIEREAQKQGITPNELVDKNAKAFKEAWERLNIKYDDFIRTTEQRHEDVVKAMFSKIFDNGYIYKSAYSGLYCVGCETFLKEKDLVDGKCPNHGTVPEKMEEENYFFALSKFEEPLKKMYEEFPDKMVPEFRKNEILNILEGGLEDVSVSRGSLNWGVRLPNDEEHVVWVWFDALINYISSIKYSTNQEFFEKYWENSLHIIGKDITRLHCIIWPAMLMAADIPVFTKVLAHGFVNMKGEKMSKSLGNVLDPMDIADKYGADPLRYYMMSEVGMIRDGDFSWELFIKRYNSDLANDLGNLLHRTKNMVKKYLGGELDCKDCSSDKKIIENTKIKTDEYIDSMNDYDIATATSKAIDIVKYANWYIDNSAPWTSFKEGNLAQVNNILYNVLESLRIATLLLYPIIPQTSEKIFDEMGIVDKPEELELNKAKAWGGYSSKKTLVVGKPIFPRIEIKKEEENKTTDTKKENIKDDNLIEFSDFEKVQMKVAEIIEAKKHPKADRLLLVKVKVGQEERQVVAGIADYYKPEELSGKRVAMVCNLKPVKLRGELSEGMLLAVKDKKELSLVTFDREVRPGRKLS